MPRVHFVKSARKDNPVAKVGESYYWWKFRYGGKRYSKTRPKQSQLTQSPYKQRMFGLMEQYESFATDSPDELQSVIDEVHGELEDIQSECQNNYDNIPEQLQYGSAGETLSERIDNLDSAMSELQSIDMPNESDMPDEADFDMEEDGQVEEYERQVQEYKEEMEAAVQQFLDVLTSIEVY